MGAALTEIPNASASASAIMLALLSIKSLPSPPSRPMALAVDVASLLAIPTLSGTKAIPIGTDTPMALVLDFAVVAIAPWLPMISSPSKPLIPTLSALAVAVASVTATLSVAPLISAFKLTPTDTVVASASVDASMLF